MTKNEKLIDELLKSCKNPEDILGEGGLLKQLTKAVVERALEAEMTDHVDICGQTGYETHEACIDGQLKPIKVHLHNIVRTPPDFDYSPQLL